MNFLTQGTLPTSMAPAPIDCVAVEVMMRVFSTSAGVVAMAARPPARPPMAMTCQCASSLPLPPPKALPAQQHARQGD